MRNNEWTAIELLVLKKFSWDFDAAQIASTLGRSIESVACKLKALDIRLPPRPKAKPKAKDKALLNANSRWQQWEKDYLKQYYHNTPMEAMMDKLSRSFQAITTQAFLLKITGRRYSDFNGMRRREGDARKNRAKRTKPPAVGVPHRIAKKAAPEKPAQRTYKTRDTITGKVPVRIGPRTVVYLQKGYTSTDVEAIKSKMNIV